MENPVFKCLYFYKCRKKLQWCNLGKDNNKSNKDIKMSLPIPQLNHKFSIDDDSIRILILRTESYDESEA